MSQMFFLLVLMGTVHAWAQPHVHVRTACELVISSGDELELDQTFEDEFILGSRDRQAGIFDPHFAPDKSVFVFSLTPSPRSIPDDLQVFTLTITRTSNPERLVHRIEPAEGSVTLRPDPVELGQMRGIFNAWVEINVHPSGRISARTIANERYVTDENGTLELNLPYSWLHDEPAKTLSLRRKKEGRRTDFNFKVRFEIHPDLGWAVDKIAAE